MQCMLNFVQFCLHRISHNFTIFQFWPFQQLHRVKFSVQCQRRNNPEHLTATGCFVLFKACAAGCAGVSETVRARSDRVDASRSFHGVFFSALFSLSNHKAHCSFPPPLSARQAISHCKEPVIIKRKSSHCNAE